MWNLPEGQQSIQTLTSTTSPFQTFVLDLTKKHVQTNAELKKLGANRKKKLNEYVTSFFNILVEKLQKSTQNAMETNQSSPTTSSTRTITHGGLLQTQDSSLLASSESMTSHNMTNPHNSFGNTTTLSSNTSMQRQPPSTSSTAMSSPNLSPIVPVSQSSTHQLDSSSIIISTIIDHETTNDDIYMDMQECHADYYLPLLFLVNIDSEFSFADESYSTVPKAKAFHEYCSEDLHPVRCVSSFLYLVFRDPLAKESTCFKAGFRTFNEPKHTYDQAKMENQRRYVTSFGMGTCHYRYATWFCMISFLFVSFF
jgi:hypothetical protein